MTYGELLKFIKSQMVQDQLDPEDKDSWSQDMCEEAHDAVLSHVAECPNLSVGFTELLGKYATYKHEDGAIPNAVNFNEATPHQTMLALVDMAKLNKFIGESGEFAKTFKSNFGEAKARVGRYMREGSQTKVELSDDAGRRRLANILLDQRYSVTWPDSEAHFEFLEIIGQGDCVQPTVPWQTDTKIMTNVIDELPEVPYDDENGVDMSGLTKTDGMFEVQSDDGTTEKRQYFQYSDDQYTYVCEKRGKGFEPLAKMYLITNAKVSKVY